jgi:hypothetical protein
MYERRMCLRAGNPHKEYDCMWGLRIYNLSLVWLYVGPTDLQFKLSMIACGAYGSTILALYDFMGGLRIYNFSLEWLYVGPMDLQF